jgi:probable HAF family extracellular repeat protein
MASYKIYALGDPSAQSVLGTEACDLNNTATVVGVASIPGWRALYWNPNPIGIPLGDVESVAYGVNDFGDIVGTRQARDIGLVMPGEAFLFRGGVFHNLANKFQGEESIAMDINNAGMVAAWGGDIGASHSFTYDANSGTVTDLGVLPGYTESYAHAINELGQVAGCCTKSGSESHAFLFDGALKDLGPATSANDINDSGQVVGARVVGGASYWTAYRCDTFGGNPQFVDLGSLPGFVGSEAMAINKDGDVVGHSFTEWGNQQIHAFICPHAAKCRI